MAAADVQPGRNFLQPVACFGFCGGVRSDEGDILLGVQPPVKHALNLPGDKVRRFRQLFGRKSCGSCGKMLLNGLHQREYLGHNGYAADSLAVQRLEELAD
ncbi:hypothetical protein D3C73_1369890 [compost metagenome]